MNDEAAYTEVMSRVTELSDAELVSDTRKLFQHSHEKLNFSDVPFLSDLLRAYVAEASRRGLDFK